MNIFKQKQNVENRDCHHKATSTTEFCLAIIDMRILAVTALKVRDLKCRLTVTNNENLPHDSAAKPFEFNPN